MLLITVIFHDGSMLVKRWNTFVDYQNFLDQQKCRMIKFEHISEVKL